MTILRDKVTDLIEQGYGDPEIARVLAISPRLVERIRISDEKADRDVARKEREQRDGTSGAWTDERIATLKKLWAEGLSGSQIAARLGLLTRAAVIGKVHRLGLSGRAKPKGTYQRARAKPSKLKSPPRPAPGGTRAALQTLNEKMPPPVFVDIVEEVEIPLAERRTIQDLTETSCRWPIGDPRAADFHFCNGTKVEGLPYCEAHSRRAFAPRSASTTASVPLKPGRIVGHGASAKRKERVNAF